jgi:hypothetical protein
LYTCVLILVYYHTLLQEISSRFKELQDKRRRERARMSSKWSEYHMKTSDGAALKDAKTKVVFLSRMLVVCGYVYVFTCLQINHKLLGLCYGPVACM